MVGDSARHAAVLDELVEWWQDLSRQEINSRAVLLPVPPRWGVTYLLWKFATFIEEDEAPCILVRVGLGKDKLLPDGLGAQALKLRELFSEAPIERSAAELLGVDRLGGAIQLGLGVAGLIPGTQLYALVLMLLGSVVTGAASQAYDTRPAGQEGAVAKLARAVAALSVSVPVVVIIDDADRLELDLAVVLIENLIERINGQVLVVVAVNPERKLLPALTARARYGLTEGRVRTVDADSDMKYPARVDLVTQRCPDLPAAAARRIGRRTRTFAEVFAVTEADRLAELRSDEADAAITAAVDEVIDGEDFDPAPSRLAVVLAWAGGVMQTRQADRAADVLRAVPVGDNSDVRRSESLARVADPASDRLAAKVRALGINKRHQLAEVVLRTAVEIGRDPRAGLIEKVVAWQATHRVRADLQDRRQLLGVQCQLVHGLEDLGDPAAAYEVAHTALGDLYRGGHPGDENRDERRQLSDAVLRLARTDEAYRTDPLVNTTIDAAIAGGAAVGLEGRAWAAIDLLAQVDQRQRAFELTDQVAAELNGRHDLGAIGNRWRLLLALHAGRAGYPAVTRELLAPILAPSGSAEYRDAAQKLHAVGGPRADTHLQIIGLEAELEALPPDADDDRLRVHHALAADYAHLGDYHQALHHFQQELPLRWRIQGADHPATLRTRSGIAFYNGASGHPAEALRLFQELLPDQERVLGPDHPDTLNTRGNIANSTGENGHPAEALRLYRELLPGLKRILGSSHYETLHTRAGLAFWSGASGHPAEALRLFQELLPDQERVLGPDHLDTLTTRGNIAGKTGEIGHPAKALQLYQELLPDLERVLGPDHPKTLLNRGNIAYWTLEIGHPVEVLQLYQELLPDLERVLGPDHFETLRIRGNIAPCTGRCGDGREALRLLLELLPDLERVLGSDYPDTLATRINIADWTGQTGHPAKALQLYQELLPDLERVLGPDHPNTVLTRGQIAYWTLEIGHQAEALRLYQELLPDQERVLGPSHADTLATRNIIATWIRDSGDTEGAMRLFAKLLPDQVRVLGPDHVDTLITRANIAVLTGRCGDRAEALRLSTELLPDLERVFGPDHAFTLAIRSHVEDLS